VGFILKRPLACALAVAHGTERLPSRNEGPPKAAILRSS